MKYFLFILTALLSFEIKAQTVSDAFINEILSYQQGLNKTFKDSLKSPLKNEDIASFTSLDFYAADESYRVSAKFKRTPKEKAFKMKTTTERLPDYVKYGELHFALNGKPYMLNVYQNIHLSKMAGFEDYLFLPFTDLTNGEETYGGGRYIDFKIPKKKIVTLDFNKAYNPYCAYNSSYSCPIPPPENFINEYVRAGVKAWKE